MEPHFSDQQVTVWHGDCVEVMREMEPESIDAIVTDPPSGIHFMGKEWDHDRGGRQQWVAWMTTVMQEALRVAKPGAHAFVWALPRTSHWTATALEDAGWDVRDIVVHLFGSGFPKSQNVSVQIDRQEYARRERAIREALRAKGYADVTWSSAHE